MFFDVLSAVHLIKFKKRFLDVFTLMFFDVLSAVTALILKSDERFHPFIFFPSKQQTQEKQKQKNKKNKEYVSFKDLS